MSLLRNLYYEIKPYLPSRTRLAFRRFLARRVLERSAENWPILEQAGNAPDGWPGWPQRKQFALVLTHDVEGERGVARSLDLARLEEKRGFRSSFNFVPEGTYTTPDELRSELVESGFEVGVHDLRHDGKLYRSEKLFRQAAQRINGYLHSWKAVGFRSGFMHHNLEWLHWLDIDYDMSTFDTDPFEPQPDGAHTIFPFWVHKTVQGVGQSRRSGYAELPYTLAQDSTVFLLLQQQSPKLWKQKLDWIAQHGGMALINVHPDYMTFSEVPELMEYRSAFYADFLDYISSKYSGAYWLALPSEVANCVREQSALTGLQDGPGSAARASLSEASKY